MLLEQKLRANRSKVSRFADYRSVNCETRSAKIQCRVGGEVKHKNLVSNELVRVKLPPKDDYEAHVSNVRFSSSHSD